MPLIFLFCVTGKTVESCKQKSNFFTIAQKFVEPFDLEIYMRMFQI